MNSLSFNNRSLFGKSSLLFILIAFAAMPACSLLTDFDQDEKPCDGYLKCEEGYYCQVQDVEKGTGVCAKTSSGILPMGMTSQTVAPEDGSFEEPGPMGLAAEEEVLPCEENACLPWPGHVCDVERQLCVPAM